MSEHRYRLISADGHFCEPGDLWTARVPERYRDRVPRIESFPEGDGWVMPGVDAVLPFGWRACAGKAPEEMGNWVRFEAIKRGCYEPAARVQEMEEDGIDAEVLYDSNGPVSFVTPEKDPDFHHAMVRAYNDWVSDFCAHDPARLLGTALIPNRGVAGAMAEVERCMELPGFVAWRLKCYPHGTTQIEEEDDALWALLQETGKPITIHVSLNDKLPVTKGARSLPGTGHFYDAPTRMLEFIFTGVLDRFPGLQIVLTEVDCGWIPYFEEQADDNFLRHAKADLKGAGLTRLPSEYMREHFPACFITDHYAIANRERVGVERMMWSNDYPHITSDWPNSWKVIKASFSGVPEAERHAMLAGNAERIFKLPPRAGAATAEGDRALLAV